MIVGNVFRFTPELPELTLSWLVNIAQATLSAKAPSVITNLAGDLLVMARPSAGDLYFHELVPLLGAVSAEFLEAHPKVSWVNYPGLASSPEHEMARKYLPDGASGVLCFGVKGGKAAGERVMNSLRLAAIVVHVADVRTCVLHPASMTHRQLTDAELEAAGVSPDMIRLSVGIENIDDIKADFDQALANA